MSRCTTVASMRALKPNRIALTGATGFLGSHLLRSLVGQGHRVTVLKRCASSCRRIEDLLPRVSLHDIDQHGLAVAFERHRFDCVIHCATDYGRKERPRATMIESNLLLPLDLLELAVKWGTQTFVNTDTLLDKRVNDYS